MYDLIFEWVHDVNGLREFIRTHRVNIRETYFLHQVLNIALREDSPGLIGEYVSLGGDLADALTSAVAADCINIIQSWIKQYSPIATCTRNGVGPRTGPFIMEHVREGDEYYDMAIAETIKCVLRNGKPNLYGSGMNLVAYTGGPMYKLASAVSCHSPLEEDLFLMYWENTDGDSYSLIRHIISDQKKHNQRHPENILRIVELIDSEPNEFEILFLESGWPELIEAVDLDHRRGNDNSRLFLSVCKGGHVPTIEKMWPRGIRTARDGIVELINKGIVEPLRDRTGWRYDMGKGRSRVTRLSRYLEAYEPGAQKSVVELNLLEYLEESNLDDLQKYGSLHANDTLLNYINRPVDEKYSNEGGWYVTCS